MKYLAKSCNDLQSLLPEIEIELNTDINKFCNLLLLEITHYQMKLSEYIQVVDNAKNLGKNYPREIRLQIYDSNQNPASKSFNDKLDKIKSEITKELRNIKWGATSE